MQNINFEILKIDQYWSHNIGCS